MQLKHNCTSKSFIFCIVMYVGLLLLPSLSFAAISDPCGCDAGKAPEVTKRDSSFDLKLAYLQTIDETTYSKLQHEGGLEANIPLFEQLGIGINATYEDFNEKRNRILKGLKYGFSREEANSYFHMHTPTDKWLSCKQDCIQSVQSTGLSCWLSELTKAASVVTCHWKPQTAQQLGAVPFSVKLNDVDVTPPDGQTIDPNSRRSFFFRREAGKESIIIFAAGGITDHVKIAAIPKVVKKTLQVVTAQGCPDNASCMGFRSIAVLKGEPDNGCSVTLKMEDLPPGMIMKTPMRWSIVKVENGSEKDFTVYSLRPHAENNIRLCGYTEEDETIQRRAWFEIEAEYDAPVPQQ